MHSERLIIFLMNDGKSVMNAFERIEDKIIVQSHGLG